MASWSAFFGCDTLGAAFPGALALTGEPFDEGATALGVPGRVIRHTRAVQLHHRRALQ